MNSLTRRSIRLLSHRILLGAMILLAGAIAYPQTSAAKDKNEFHGSLWVANGTNVLAFNLTGLKKGIHNSKPNFTLTSANGFVNAQGVVFDAHSNLWVIDAGNTSVGGSAFPSVQEFSWTTLKKKSRKPVMPSVSVVSSFFISPRQAAFDSSGNLWVSDEGANALFVFNPTQLLTGGAPTPVTVLASTPSPFAWSLGIAFDSSSNLWVANNEGNSIYKFNASKLPGPTTTGVVTLTPDVVLTDDGDNSIQVPWAIRFDSTGNLWSDNAGSLSTVVEFAKADLGVTGSPTPVLTLSPTTDRGNATLTEPNGLAFDTVGNLAVVNTWSPSSIAVFDASQFTPTPEGDLIPNSLVSGGKTGLDSPAGCAVGPAVK